MEDEGTSTTAAELSVRVEPPQQPKKPTVHEPVSGYDSDDSLTGYASPSSSRSASPTPSELEEIERDPTLRVGIKKVPRPVYLAQLGEMVRSTSGLKGGDEDMEARKIEVALEVAEELIRRKSGYGTELEENAVNLAYGFIGLQDNYDLEGFDEKRQAALNALVACCPRKAAPTIIEQFFSNQYSTNQRFAMLNALALGARELASLPLPTTSTRPQISAERITFPSKRLPSALHKKYLTAGDQLNANNPVQLMLEDISREAIDKGKEATADKVPEFVRERQLRIRQPPKVTEVTPAGKSRLSGQQVAPRRTTFTEVAAECFICPLINRFWLFLRDEQTREARTAHQPALHRYRGAGTGLVLGAMVLARFLATLAVLVHAARNASVWLAVIAPDALELAVTLGTRPVSQSEGEDEDADESGGGGATSGEGGKGKEAAVLTAALELALVVLDGCLELDGGRSLCLEHTTLLLGAGEWAGEVFGRLEKGTRVLGGAGSRRLT
ncbi:DNA replication checkpoint protein tel2 [Grifola frondosa]|uniref:DNA replication checkpoint protein tel2 n=1 Tax=Grifola frondosa TaxID=5627 RepID=A0A1C7MGV3_GRIFR|nr:DNA replication checkpoint protein tel2 [Grifola frondosa]